MSQQAGSQLTDNVYLKKPWKPFYAPGVSSEIAPIPYESIADMATKTAQKYKERPAITLCLDNGMTGTLTYEEVDELSTRFASFLRFELGLEKGDRVAVQLPNCLAYPVVSYGVFKAGCVLVNVNPLYTEREMEHQLNDSESKTLVIIDMFADKLTHVVAKTRISTIVSVSVADFFPFLKRTLIKTVLKIKKKIPEAKVHTIPLTTAMAQGGAHLASRGSLGNKDKKGTAVTISLDDIAALQYTGGTTGVSKGAMLSHRNLLTNMLQVTMFGSPKLDFEKQEVILTVLPLYHIFAFTVNNLTFFNLGAHNVMIPNPRPPSNMKPAFEKFKFTWMTGVNTLYNALSNEDWFLQNPPRSLKISIAGGTALHKAVAEKWEKIVGSPVVEGFGLTESSPVITFNPIGGKVVPDSVGIPFPSTDVMIVDDEGNPVPQGETGEIIARGPQIMLGYWKRPDETAKTLKDGWLYTGDIAVMDEEGFFKIVDRKKDMILVSGFNVYPNEVEDCISQHPDVLEVAVIGIPDEACGEAVKAYIIKKNESLTQEEVRRHCKTMLTGYKIPKTVEFRTELPKTPIGKILRKELRAELKKS